MADSKISPMVASDLTNAITDYSSGTETTNGPTDQKETFWQNDEWTDELASYKKHPEINKVIDAIATWVVGKGFTADPQTEFILNTIKGNGTDTFNSILRNLQIVMEIGGDSYAEIIRDNEGNLINLKPLDPGSMKHVANRQGLIIRFEQTNKVKAPVKKFKPEQIFYLPRNRMADEVSGQSLAKILKWIIEAKQEAIRDYRIVQHWNVKPRWKHRLKTDDSTEIAEYKAKQDKAKAEGEDIYEPYDVCESELIAVPPNATMNPMTWIQYLDSQIYEQSGCPRIIVGGASEFVEKATAVVYLAWQQTVEAKQLFIEEQVGMQLGLEINLEFPASLANELISDKQKDGETNIDAGKTKIGQTEE